jgi:hypothetical protein
MPSVSPAEKTISSNRTVGAASRRFPGPLVLLLLLTFAALLVHGYHPWAEDGELYLPGVEKLLNPALFPFNSRFFEPHARSTLFPNLIADSVRLTHLRLETVLFIWQLASIFLFLLACWELSRRCFPSPRAQWAGVALATALLTMPVAGTALYLMDQYVNPRNLVAFAMIFAIVKVLDRKYAQAGLFLLAAATIHPLMPVFALSYCVLIVLLRKLEMRPGALALLLPFGLTLNPPSKSYHVVAQKFAYFFVTRWAWYEWLGALAPLAILWWFTRIARARGLRNLDLLCRALIIYEVLFIPPALVLSTVPRFEALARLQPMRCLYITYALMLLFGGGLLADYMLKNRWWRWAALFVPLCAGMFIAQRSLFPASAHIEWPGVAPRNPWLQAFVWIRHNTPGDAIFALDPEHMQIAGEDHQGFRAVAQRSMLADDHDSGAVSMFPVIADDWLQQTQALAGWEKFQLRDFRRLQAQYGVSWVVLQQPGVAGLECPYENRSVLVCRIPPSAVRTAGADSSRTEVRSE